MSALAILIPTFQRPDAAAAALASVFAQGADLTGCELVVVDNCPRHSARERVAPLIAAAPLPSKLLHAPRPGVATARNAAFAGTDAPMVVFLDDDQRALPGWLAALRATQAALDADLVFGPQRARAPDPSWAFADLLEDLHTRDELGADAVIAAPFATGNCLINRARLALPIAPFDVDRDETGGEDDAFFALAMARGARLAWSQDAVVEEDIAASRARLSYLLARNFAFGQSPCQDAAAATPPQALSLVRHMGVGALQTLGYGVAGALVRPVARRTSARFLNRSLQGLGKSFWFLGAPRFYGASALAPAR